MKKFLFLVSISLIGGLDTYSQYNSENITLYSNWYDPAVVAEPYYGIKYNSVWGYADPGTGREFAIIGSTAGTYFLEVTNPSTPVLKNFIAGRRNKCIWREYKTYSKYLYMVSDDAAPNSLQIADLSTLATTGAATLVYDSDSIFVRAHTIFIDGDKLYGGSVTTKSTYYSMAVYSLVNPVRPLLLRSLNQDQGEPSTVHDMLVKNDTVYASGGYNGLYIFKFDTSFTLLNSFTSYPGQGYNHSSALTPDGKTLVFTDEVPANLPVKVLDVSDLSNLQIKSSFKSNEGATAHNVYMKDNKLIIAYYQDGLYIYDLKDPANPKRTGFFDTYPQNGSIYTSPTYAGNWGAYVDLPSGNILASDMQNGLFVLNATNALASGEKTATKDLVSMHPNPFSGSISINILSREEQQAKVKIFDVTGKLVLDQVNTLSGGSNNINLSTESLPAGVYIINIDGINLSIHRKMVKVE